MAAYRNGGSFGSNGGVSQVVGSRIVAPPSIATLPRTFVPVNDPEPNALTKIIDNLARKACSTGQLQYAWIEVCPDDIDAVLNAARNDTNFSLMRSQVENIKDLMETGAFNPGLEHPLEFNWQGKILSAQHRLTAQKELGHTYTYYVVVGNPTDVNTRDIRESAMPVWRKAEHAARMAGEPFLSETTAKETSRFVLLLHAYQSGVNNGSCFSYTLYSEDDQITDCLKYREVYEDLIDRVKYRSSKYAGFRMSKVNFLFHYYILATESKNPKAARQFMEDLVANNPEINQNGYLQYQLKRLPGSQRARDIREVQWVIEAFNSWRTNPNRRISPAFSSFDDPKNYPPLPKIK